jgi:hypothetical protein
VVARREGFERWFHRADLVQPELVGLHADETRLPTVDEERRFLARKRLRTRRLFRPKKADVEILGQARLLKWRSRTSRSPGSFWLKTCR